MDLGDIRWLMDAGDPCGAHPATVDRLWNKHASAPPSASARTQATEAARPNRG
jgi:hypothetical protein